MNIDSILRHPVLQFPPILFCILFMRNILQIIMGVIQGFLGKNKDSNIAYMSCFFFYGMNVTTHSNMPMLPHILFAIAFVATAICSVQNSRSTIMMRFFGITILYAMMVHSVFMEMNINIIDDVSVFMAIYGVCVPIYSFYTYRIIRKYVPNWLQRPLFRWKSVVEETQDENRNVSLLTKETDKTELVIEMQKKHLIFLKHELTRSTLRKDIEVLSALGGVETPINPQVFGSETEDIHSKIKELLSKQAQIKSDIKREQEKWNMRDIYLKYKECSLATKPKTSG